MQWILPVGTALHGDVKMKKFKVGDRVGWPDDEMVFNEDDGPSYGTIVEIVEGNLKVKWDDSSVQQYHGKKLFNQNALWTEAKLKKEWSRLEKEFTVLEVKLSKKIDQAAELLLEANKIALEGGRELIDMEATYSLLNAMREVGWRTSALNC
jgi:hypothetical protein